jgi:hypothetical protein
MKPARKTLQPQQKALIHLADSVGSMPKYAGTANMMGYRGGQFVNGKGGRLCAM